MRIKRTLFQVALVAVAFVPTVVLLKTAVADNPQGQDAATYYEQGAALFKAEKFEEAVKAFTQAIKLKPDHADAYSYLGDAYYELGDVKKAADAYKQAIRYKPDSAVIYEKLGTAYRGRGDYKKAIEAYNESIRLNPKAQLTHYNLGAIYADRENEQSAVAEYKILQTLDPNLAQDLYNLIYKPTIPIAANGTVRLNVMAVDAHGVPITDLMSEDFRVTEDGATQTVSIALKGNTPTFYGVAIDTSGSLRPIFPLVIAASKQIIERILPDNPTLLIRFISSDKIETVQDFTSNKRRLTDAVDHLYIEGGQSAVLDAVYLAAQRVAGYKFPETNVRRVLLLLTDGDDRASYYSLQQVLALLRSVDLQIFVISLSADDRGGRLNEDQPKRSAELLRVLASETGGAAFFPKSPAELKPTINAIFDLVRAEYTIQYKPTKPIEAGIYRPVSVTVSPRSHGENATVLSRPGYLLSVKELSKKSGSQRHE